MCHTWCGTSRESLFLQPQKTVILEPCSINLYRNVPFSFHTWRIVELVSLVPELQTRHSMHCILYADFRQKPCKMSDEFLDWFPIFFFINIIITILYRKVLGLTYLFFLHYSNLCLEEILPACPTKHTFGNVRGCLRYSQFCLHSQGQTVNLRTYLRGNYLVTCFLLQSPESESAEKKIKNVINKHTHFILWVVFLNFLGRFEQF